MNGHTPDAKAREVDPAHKPKRSEPHEGHGGTKYEGIDASAAMVLWSLAIIGVTLVIVFAITIGIQKWLRTETPVGELPSPLAPARVVPPNPQLQVHPWEELPDLRAHENETLSSYGKDPDGHVHVPINQAMDAVVSRLNIGPNASQGITSPGGEGRDFAGSVNAMPPPYRRPQIQGEIRKHAQ
ncbi:MAG: hypothetical protein JO097_05605 [Acidobacteriaceae bacterium]|nr:hypothetical protein [Acidobacteriaceae bacterium]MBV9766991.1 hypothetical protein [Acidobacteriaceae bacterium]